MFGSDREGAWGLFSVTADGTGDVVRLMIEGNLVPFIGRQTYDVTPDGQHFVILTRGGAETTDDDAPPTLVVVQHWLAEH